MLNKKKKTDAFEDQKINADDNMNLADKSDEITENRDAADNSESTEIKEDAEDTEDAENQESSDEKDSGKIKRGRKRRKKKRKLDKRAILVMLVLFLSLIVLLVLVFLFKKQVDSYKLKDTVFTCAADMKVEYEKGAVLSDKDGFTVLKTKNGEEYLSHDPLYQDLNSLILPSQYLLVRGFNQGMYCVDRFSEVTLDSGVTIKDGNTKKTNVNGFLYDGGNTYIFLDRVTLRAGSEELSLPPLSYLNAYQGDRVDVYQATNDKVYSIETGTDSPEAEFSNGDIIALDSDTVTRGNGQVFLLSTTPDFFKKIENMKD